MMTLFMFDSFCNDFLIKKKIQRDMCGRNLYGFSMDFLWIFYGVLVGKTSSRIFRGFQNENSENCLMMINQFTVSCSCVVDRININ